MSFQIDFKGKSYRYDLGTSEIAKKACKGLDIYKRNNAYGNLRRLFAELAWIVSEGNPYNKQACLATHILALSVFQSLHNCYQKLFVAISVTSIYANAKYQIPTDWIKAQQYGNIVEQVLNSEVVVDLEELQNSGLAYIDIKSGEQIIPPIPEYSI